jgi:hypothetical protein
MRDVDETASLSEQDPATGAAGGSDLLTTTRADRNANVRETLAAWRAAERQLETAPETERPRLQSRVDGLRERYNRLIDQVEIDPD